MGERTSNKEILVAIEGQTASIDKLVTALTQQVLPATREVPDAANGGDLEIDGKYLAHQNMKAADHATAKGSEVVLYARKNKRGETKLAYALRERYDTVIAGQPSHLGAVGSFNP